jgi:sugar phosphate isomerase/epimerase
MKAQPASARDDGERDHDLMLCWGTVNASTMLELIDAAAVGGYDSISVSPRLYAASLTAGVTNEMLRAALDAQNVRVAVIEPLLSGLPGAHTPDSAPPEHRTLYEFTEDYCYAMAEAIGAQTISLSHFLGSPVPVSEMIDAIGPIVSRAHERGFAVCVEFIPDTGIDTLATARQIYDAIDDDGFGVMWDAWHFARSGGTLEQLVGLPPGMVTIVQLSDRIESEPGAAYVPMAGRLLPGKGDLPLVKWTNQLLADHPDAVIGVEVFSGDLQAMSAAEAALLAAVATRDVLADV